jgi:hypothetical protein
MALRKSFRLTWPVSFSSNSGFSNEKFFSAHLCFLRISRIEEVKIISFAPINSELLKRMLEGISSFLKEVRSPFTIWDFSKKRPILMIMRLSKDEILNSKKFFRNSGNSLS